MAGKQVLYVMTNGTIVPCSFRIVFFFVSFQMRWQRDVLKMVN